MITVHHLENSRSQRVLWLLEELERPYEVKRYERDPKTNLGPPELYAVHPLGKSPVITDGDITVAETGAIFEYLVNTYDKDFKLRPTPEDPKSRDYTYWLHYAEGSAMTYLLLKLVFSRMPESAPMLVKPVVKGISSRAESSFIDPRIIEHATWWNRALDKTGHFVGDDLSAADIMMSFPLEAAATRSDFSNLPNVKAFIANMQAREKYKIALERGGPYAYA
ncbi:MAG: glutathione S-transferase [Pseudomonadota bacterium]